MKKLLFFPLFLILLVLPINAFEFQQDIFSVGTIQSQLSAFDKFLYALSGISPQVALDGVEYDCRTQSSSGEFIFKNPTPYTLPSSFSTQWARVEIVDAIIGSIKDGNFIKRGQTISYTSLVNDRLYYYNLYKCTSGETPSCTESFVGYECSGDLISYKLERRCNPEITSKTAETCPTAFKCSPSSGRCVQVDSLPDVPACDESLKNTCSGSIWLQTANGIVLENSQYKCVQVVNKRIDCGNGCDSATGQCRSSSQEECIGLFSYYDKSKNCGAISGFLNKCPDNINTFKTLAGCQKRMPTDGQGFDLITTPSTPTFQLPSTPTSGSGGGVTQTPEGITSSGCAKDGSPAQYTFTLQGINNNCCSGKTSDGICLADNPSLSDDETSTDDDKKRIKKEIEDGTAKNVTIFKPFAISIQDSDLGEASSGSIVRAICHVSENCQSYEDLQGNTNYSVRCVSTSTTEQKIEETTKKECDKFTPKLLASIGGVGFAGCLSGIALMLSGVGSIGGAVLASLCVATPVGITAVGSTQLALEAGCELNKQKLGDGLCIATKKSISSGSFVDSLKGGLESVGSSLNEAFGGEAKTGITGTTMGYLLLILIIVIIIIVFSRKK